MTARNPMAHVPPAWGWRIPYAGRAAHVTATYGNRPQTCVVVA